ncbi:hypothetical protein BDB00DRAFT_875613 [Zychaea mexicana]|uniref:uncharacterized protein n=1 Tax=Zychaea mexicana TaxID=64656 RepID=UPI0022FDEABC|nr:uncharacterized protein BDB00DRAFT_875613 [Zychaea mexicana]KAI9490155.1 hypothetical protein BDB00DRAFT_875613 [Zychaea mexicana]
MPQKSVLGTSSFFTTRLLTAVILFTTGALIGGKMAYQLKLDFPYNERLKATFLVKKDLVYGSLSTALHTVGDS